MRPITLTTTGVQVSAVCPLDIYISPFNVTLDVVLNGAATYTVEYTDDDIFAKTFNPATANWIPHADLTAKAAAAQGTLISPVRAVRLNQTAGAGSASLRVIQAGTGA
jgi:hypothetical protein